MRPNKIRQLKLGERLIARAGRKEEIGQKITREKFMKTAEMDKTEARRFRRGEEYIEPEPEAGLFGSIRHVLATTLAVFQSRVELIAVELKELKGRALAVVGWGVALIFLSFLTMVAIMATVVFLLWDQALAVLVGFSAFFLVAAIGSFLVAKGQLKKIPFGETVEQLRKDRELILKQASDEEDDQGHS